MNWLYGYKSEEVANSVQQGVENVKIAFLMVFLWNSILRITKQHAK
jgi:hypothetical protein